jgi:uncharacterized protein (DUF1684 family)
MPRFNGLTKLVPLILVLLAGPGHAANDAYVAGIHEWQRQFAVDVRTGGWLFLVGRYKVAEGESFVGSAPTSSIVLPPDAPQALGKLTRRLNVIQFEPRSGVAVTIDDKPASGIVELGTARGSGRVRAGDISFAVRSIGDDYYALVQDSNNPAARNFKALTWFSVDPAYRVRAKFVPYPQAESVAVPMTHIDSKEVLASTGDVTFRLQGTDLRLKSFVEGDKLFLMFQDPTNGAGTYGGGRFLYAPLPTDGGTILGFNKAFNPFCSVNDYVVCPVVPTGNRLSVRVAPGEKYSGERSR